MRICVFAASSEKIDRKYIDGAYALAYRLAKAGHQLVYGGGKEGIMGAFARGFKDGQGPITAITPTFYRDIIYSECDTVIVTETMAERKEKMIDLAEVLIAMEGGIGTYDELFDAMCMNMVGTMNKKLLIYNANGYYTKLLEILRENQKEHFISDLNSFSEVCSDEEVLKILEG